VRVRTVIFDLFDTLLLVKGGDAFYEPALRRLQASSSKRALTFPLRSLSKYILRLEMKCAWKLHKAWKNSILTCAFCGIKKLGYDFDVSNPAVQDGTRAFAEEFMHHVDLNKEAVETPQRLRGKYRIKIVLNLSISEAAWELLEKFDLKKYFDAIIVSGDVEKRKPSSEIFEKAIKF